MYENNIEELLSKDKVCGPIFKGCLARDELPVLDKYPSCFIFNTQNRSGNGEHWLAIYVDNQKKLYFFDSYGLSPSYYNLKNYIEINSKSNTWNSTRLQGSRPYCGYYCILFLLYVSRNKLKLFFNKFKKDFNYNDNFIYNNMIKYLE